MRRHHALYTLQVEQMRERAAGCRGRSVDGERS